MRMSHLWKRPWLLPALALTLALAAVGCSSAKTDAQLAGEVQNKINGDLPAQRIVVSVAGGTVTLSGTVNRDDERLKASSDAAEIEGVKTVINNLQVAPAAASIPEAPPPAPPQSRPAVTRSSPSHSKVRSTEMASNDSPSSPAPAVIPPFTPPPPPDPIPAAPEHVTIPAGTTVSVRMVDGLDSEVNQVGDTFRASLESPIMVEDRVVAPAGTEVQGRVTDVKSAGHFKGRSELTMQLVRLQMNGKSYTLATSVWNAKGSSRGTRTAATIGGGSALGAIIGAIAGGGKGAAIGAAAGAGAGTGVQGITKGKPIKVQPEDVLQFRLANDVTVVPSASGAATRDPDRPRLERR